MNKMFDKGIITQFSTAQDIKKNPLKKFACFKPFTTSVIRRHLKMVKNAKGNVLPSQLNTSKLTQVKLN